MVHTFQNLKTSNLTLDLEIHQYFGSLKYVINIIMWIKDMMCYNLTMHVRALDERELAVEELE
jgi:hypothetical protein